MPKYYKEKIKTLRDMFISSRFSKNQIYELNSSLDFFQKEFENLDSRTKGILVSEITRITNTFISDYDVVSTFCSPKEKLNFNGFENVIKDGKIAVPIYVKEHQALMAALEQLTEECIYEDMKCLLTMPEIISPLLCSKHGVNQKEIANELYHIVFGQLNEELVACGFVAQPNRYPKEGRYLQSIEIM